MTLLGGSATLEDEISELPDGIHLLHLGHKDHDTLAPALDVIFRDVAAGTLRPVLDRSFPLDRGGAVAAHQYLHQRKNLGKVVLGADL